MAIGVPSIAPSSGLTGLSNKTLLQTAGQDTSGRSGLAAETVISKLRRGLAVSNKPVVAMTTQPTASASTTPTLTANVKPYNALSGLVNLLGAAWIVDTTNGRLFAMTSDKTGVGTAYTTSASYGNRSGYSGTIDFWYDDQKIEIDAAFTDFRVMVFNSATNQFETAYAVINTTTARTNTLLDFGSRATRQIRIEMQSLNSLYNIRLQAATSTIWPVIPPGSIRGICLTDSYGEGGGGGPGIRFDGCYHDLGRRLGILDWTISALGGTGVITPNAPSVSYLNRVSCDLIQRGPWDVIWLAGSGNDAGQTSAAITAGWGQLIDQVIAAFPAALVIVSGSWTTSGNDTTRAPVTAAIQAALATRPSMKYVDMSTWITGTGHQGATTGDGNADYYMDNVTPYIHPYKPDGHAYRGNRMALATANLLAAIS